MAEIWQEKLVALVEEKVDERLESLFAAALADPDVNEDAKSLAGFMLQRISAETKAEK